MSIPAYLQEPPEAEHYYGELIPIRYGQGDVVRWQINGEPCVAQLAKRLFPGSKGRGSDKAEFPNSKRIIGDLNWLMLRYPLKIRDSEAWESAKESAVQHVTKRMEILKRPQKMDPPAMEFKGELKDFQKEGLAYLVHNERTLLADDMGLGKSVQALAFLSATQSYPSLIVCPPHLIKNWQKEIDKFICLPEHGQLSLFEQQNERRVHVIKGLKPYDLPAASVYIIHYLLLRGWKNYLPGFGFKAVVFDEIQELRHTGTEKYSAASLLSGSVKYSIGLSGTPIYNRGGEIYNVVNAIEYHCLGDWYSFTREWCHGYGSDVVKDPVLLGDYLKREGLLLRRSKQEVMSQLPPKRRVVQSIDFDEGKYGSLIQGAVDKAVGIDSVVDYFEKGRITREIVNDSRRAIGIAKASYVAAFVKMLVEGGERVLLFAYHHDVWDIYREELKAFRPVFITGRETAKQKEESINTFKHRGTDICCISLRSASGLNDLQSATCAVFGELDWSPAIHSQAEDRIQRIGVDETLDSILSYYLVAENGTDEVIQEFLGLKVSQFVGIMGDKPETEEDKVIAQNVATEHMKKIVNRLKSGTKAKKGEGERQSA